MDDLISRQEAIEALFDWEMIYNWDDHCREEDPKPAYIVSPSDVIEQLPSAQPERKKGRWCEHYSHEDGERDGVQCSECGTHYYFGGQLMNFCPNCGADMRGKDDGKQT